MQAVSQTAVRKAQKFSLHKSCNSNKSMLAQPNLLKGQKTQTKRFQTIRTSVSTRHQERSTSKKYGEGREIVVIGAGPGGLLTATLLAQRGFQVNVFEKRPPPDYDEKHHGSRSIVFGLLMRGQQGFQKAGMRLPQRDQQDSIWLNGLALAKGAYRVQYKDGKVESSFGRLPPTVLFVERAALVEHMISEIERLEPERVKLHYGQDLMKVDFNKQQAVFRDPNGSETSKYYDFMVGCDGRRSAVRGLLEAHDPDMHHEEHVSDRSYKGFHRLPPIDSIDLGDETGIPLHFHLYGGSVQFNAAFWPTRYGTVTGQISCPRSWFDDHPNTEETYADLFRSYYPRFPEEWIPEASKQLVAARAAPNGASVKCSKLHGPNTVILGDAAHGVTPALGQGCNAALESAVILSEILDKCQSDLTPAAEMFSKARLSDVHALYNMDRNSRTMSGFSGRRSFKFYAGRFHALLGMILNKIFPFWFKGPAYINMMRDVVPYAKVLRAVQRDRWIFGALLLSAASFVILASKNLLGFAAAKVLLIARNC